MSTNQTSPVAGSGKFLFERSFDEGPNAKQDPRVEEAFAKGRKEGLQLAQQEAQRLEATESTKLVDQLASLEAMRLELALSMSRQAVDLATGLIRKMMPSMCERGGFAEIEALMADVLSRVLEEPRVVFRVPDAMLDPMQARIAKLVKKAAYAGDIVMIADDRLGVSDCLVEWADGGAERNIDRIWEEVDAMLSRALDTTFSHTSPTGEPTTNSISS